MSLVHGLALLPAMTFTHVVAVVVFMTLRFYHLKNTVIQITRWRWWRRSLTFIMTYTHIKQTCCSPNDPSPFPPPLLTLGSCLRLPINYRVAPGRVLAAKNNHIKSYTHAREQLLRTRFLAINNGARGSRRLRLLRRL